MDIYNPLTVRQRCKTYIDGAGSFPAVPEGIKGVCRGKLVDAVAMRHTVKGKQVLDEQLTDENRYLVLGFLFTPENEPIKLITSSSLTDAEWLAYSMWVRAEKIDNGWQARAAFVVEAQWILNVAKLICSWTDHYLRKDKVAHPISAFFPALADRLREKVEAESVMDAQAAAISLGGIPAQEGQDFYGKEQPAEPVVAQPWPGAKHTQSGSSQPAAVDGLPPDDAFPQKSPDPTVLEKTVAWLMLNGQCIGEGMSKGDDVCRQIVACYQLLQKSPSDLAALGILLGYIDTYKAAHPQP